MNIKDENGGSQMGAGFSIEDGKKLTEAYETLCNENNNVLIIGDDEGHLDDLFMEFYNAVKADKGLFTHRLLSPTLEEFTALVNKLVGQVTIEQALVNNAPLKHVIFVPDVVRETQSEWAACESALNAIPGVQVRMVSCARRAALDMNLLYTSLKKSACKIFFFDGPLPNKTLESMQGEATEGSADGAANYESPSEQMPVRDRSSENTTVSSDLAESRSLTTRFSEFASRPSIVFLMTFSFALFVLWSEYIVLPDAIRTTVLHFGEIFLNLWDDFLARVKSL